MIVDEGPDPASPHVMVFGLTEYDFAREEKPVN